MAKRQKNVTSANLPPGPPYPGIINTILWLRSMPWLLESSRKRYGDLWTLKMLQGVRFVFISEPALVEQVLTEDSAVLNGEARVITPLVGKNSVIVLNGPEHTVQRTLLLASLHGDRIQRFREVVTRLCEEDIASWPLNEPVKLLPRMEELTLSSIMSVIFGVTDRAKREVLRARVHTLTAYRDRPWSSVRMQAAFMKGWDPPAGFRQALDPVDTLLYEEIARAHRDEHLEDRDDILATLVQARHEDGSPMSDLEIRDELMTLLIQGHSSTAAALSWVVERLARNPESLDRLRAEGETDSDEYLDAVIKETLRVRPSLPVMTRRVMVPYQLGAYQLEPETLLAVNAFMLHRRPDIYPEPDRFRPERFLERPAGRYTWIPFGGDVRHCAGRSFATMEMKIVLRTLVDRLRFEPVQPQDEKLRRRGIVLSPTEGAEITIRERRSAAQAAIR